MTPDDVLGHASRVKWKELLVIGGTTGDGEIVSLNAGMTRRDALWLLEREKLRVLQLIDDDE